MKNNRTIKNFRIVFEKFVNGDYEEEFERIYASKIKRNINNKEKDKNEKE